MSCCCNDSGSDCRPGKQQAKTTVVTSILIDSIPIRDERVVWYKPIFVSKRCVSTAETVIHFYYTDTLLKVLISMD